ncbi:hypothetical protein H6B08_15815 [Phocaeicola plebeius]|nr:hypothetical protein [Phocaeicola plebeius]
MGMYISSDPIGLEGDNPTLYGYVEDSNILTDILGLSKYVIKIFLGRKIYQNTTDFVIGRPDFVDSSVHPSIRAKIRAGATNLDLMNAGNAPIGIDGKPINLHHILGQEPGAMVELTQTAHQKYSKQLHGLIEDGQSFRNNPILAKSYKNFKANYWKNRAKQLSLTKKCT